MTPQCAYTSGMTRQSKMRPAFNALHAATLDRATTAERLAALLTAADAVAERHRLSEGAVYTSALRRYQMLTGTDWRAGQLTEQTTLWGESDHRYRETSRPDGSYDARCSCGAATVVFTAQTADGQGHGPSWHTSHIAGSVPGQVPAGRP